VVLIGISAIARKMGVTRQRVRQIIDNPRLEFPEPAATVDNHPAWHESDIEVWLDANRPGWRDKPPKGNKRTKSE
jgi:predicted DNA-binding transcriptional regulator AlpA